MLRNKNKLKKEYISAKENLRSYRLSRELSTQEVASYIGLERRQYELKEKGKYPFHDYEMKILSKKFDKSIEYLFF